jgi:hypothetical protein
VALRRRTFAIVGIAAAICASLAYLRDPPWLLSVTSGLRPWQTDADGHRFRWMGGHASLFVPSDARVVTLPLRTTFGAGDPPVTATISIDDRPADRLVLQDSQWHASTVRLPQKGSRRVRRIDIRVDRTREDNHGAAVGEISIR